MCLPCALQCKGRLVETLQCVLTHLVQDIGEARTGQPKTCIEEGFRAAVEAEMAVQNEGSYSEWVKGKASFAVMVFKN